MNFSHYQLFTDNFSRHYQANLRHQNLVRGRHPNLVRDLSDMDTVNTTKGMVQKTTEMEDLEVWMMPT